MTESADRERLRQTFNTAAKLYLEARPDYPDELYAALIGLAELEPDRDALCEVGAGPAKATLPLARRAEAPEDHPLLEDRSLAMLAQLQDVPPEPLLRPG